MKKKEDQDETPNGGSPGVREGDGQPVNDLDACLQAVLAVCPDLNGGQLPGIVMECARRATTKVRELENRIEESGSISSETSVRFMVFGAIAQILGGMPEEDDRRKLLEAGRKVGDYIAQRWQARIEKELTRREGGN